MQRFQNNRILGNGCGSTVSPVYSRNAGSVFSCRCTPSGNGKIVQKEESGPFGRTVYQYAYDGKGHLTEVLRNGRLNERYVYDQEGRRIEDYLAASGADRYFIYGYDGALIRVDDAYLEWTPAGQLKAVCLHDRRVEYHYGSDTRLDTAYLPCGTVVRYQYADGLMPVAVFADYEPVFEYVWKDLCKLQRCIDIRNKVSYDFFHNGSWTPQGVTIQGPADCIQRLTGVSAPLLQLRIGSDQVGSVRLLSTIDGRPLKFLEYDAFGNITGDSRPEWQFPLGFAGGLHDAFTGFIRFGFRDYAPRFGRFTAKDPIGDTGGDHDLWDYCVDDPIGSCDPMGLKPVQAEAEPGGAVEKSSEAQENGNKADDYSWFRKNMAWWTLPHNHPIHKRKSEALTRSMSKELTQFGTAFIEMDQLVPTSLLRFLSQIAFEHKQGPVSKYWNKNGTRRN